jgi:thymidylate kinase
VSADPERSPFAHVLTALAGADLAVEVRKDVSERELDLAVAGPDREQIDAILRTAGFERFHARGQRGHRFYLACERGEWLKVDVVDAERRGRSRRAAAAASLLPLAWRRTGPVLAFVGPDGAGKGTLIATIRDTLPVAVTVHYLGSGGAATAAAPGADRRLRTRLPPVVREPLFVVKKLTRAGVVLTSAYASAWRGAIVLCDRHPLEALATRPPRTRGAAAIERFLLRRVLPRPDVLVVLDAPTDVLLTRKAEHPREVIDAWRIGYRSAFSSWNGAYLCSTNAPLADVAADLRARVWAAAAARGRFG